MSRYFILYHARTMAFVAVGVAAIAAIFYVQHDQTAKLRASQIVTASRLRQSQLDGCARGNILRAQVNNTTRIVRYFMRTAAAARQRTGKPLDLVSAARYRAFASSLSFVPIPDCAQVIPPIEGAP